MGVCMVPMYGDYVICPEFVLGNKVPNTNACCSDYVAMVVENDHNIYFKIKSDFFLTHRVLHRTHIRISFLPASLFGKQVY